MILTLIDMKEYPMSNWNCISIVAILYKIQNIKLDGELWRHSYFTSNHYYWRQKVTI